MFFKLGVLKSFANFTGSHLCWSLFLENLHAGGMQLYKRKTTTKTSTVKFAKFLKTSFFSEHLWWLLLYFFKKWLSSYFATSLWRANNFFFSAYRLMYKKSNLFVDKFVVNCQVFITPSGCILFFRYLSMCL